MPLVRKRALGEEGSALDAPASKRPKNGRKRLTEFEKIGYTQDFFHSLHRSFPRNLDSLYSLLMREIGSFLNGKGGIICFGCRENGTVYGEPLPRKEEDNLRLIIDNVFKKFKPMVPPQRYRVTCTHVRDYSAREPRVVVEIRIQAGEDYEMYEDYNHETYLRKRDAPYGPITPHEIKRLTTQQLREKFKALKPIQNVLATPTHTTQSLPPHPYTSLPPLSNTTNTGSKTHQPTKEQNPVPPPSKKKIFRLRRRKESSGSEEDPMLVAVVRPLGVCQTQEQGQREKETVAKEEPAKVKKENVEIIDLTSSPEAVRQDDLEEGEIAEENKVGSSAPPVNGGNMPLSLSRAASGVGRAVLTKSSSLTHPLAHAVRSVVLPARVQKPQSTPSATAISAVASSPLNTKPATTMSSSNAATSSNTIMTSSTPATSSSTLSKTAVAKPVNASTSSRNTVASVTTRASANTAKVSNTAKASAGVNKEIKISASTIASSTKSSASSTKASASSNKTGAVNTSYPSKASVVLATSSIKASASSDQVLASSSKVCVGSSKSSASSTKSSASSNKTCKTSSTISSFSNKGSTVSDTSSTNSSASSTSAKVKASSSIAKSTASSTSAKVKASSSIAKSTASSTSAKVCTRSTKASSTTTKSSASLTSHKMCTRSTKASSSTTKSSASLSSHKMCTRSTKASSTTTKSSEMPVKADERSAKTPVTRAPVESVVTAPKPTSQSKISQTSSSGFAESAAKPAPTKPNNTAAKKRPLPPEVVRPPLPRIKPPSATQHVTSTNSHDVFHRKPHLESSAVIYSHSHSRKKSTNVPTVPYLPPPPSIPRFIPPPAYTYGHWHYAPNNAHYFPNNAHYTSSYYYPTPVQAAWNASTCNFSRHF